MKKISLILLLALFYFPLTSFAQETPDAQITPAPEDDEVIDSQTPLEEGSSDEGLPEEALEMRPIIRAEEIVEVNKNIIFDASSSVIPEGGPPISYQWDLGDGTELFGEEVVHTYANSGNYTVKLTLTKGEQTEIKTQKIFVYSKLVLLLTDAVERKGNILNLKKDAAEVGTHLFILDSYEATTAFMSEEMLYSQLQDNISALNAADGIAVWTTQGSGVNVLTRLVQQSSEKEKKSMTEAFGNKTILVITDENIDTFGRILQGSFNILQPKQMIIARQYELRNFIASDSDEIFLDNLNKSISDYKLINAETGKISLWNAMSYLVNFMISKGIQSNTIILLLMLPVIVTVIAFLKQVVGITTLGLYTPSIITLSFLALGWQLGLMILLIIVLAGGMARMLLHRFNLLHIPRVAIILTFSTLIIFLTLALGTYWGIAGMTTIAVFPMLIMITLAEKFVIALGGKSFFSTFLLVLETTLVAFICYWVVEWHYLQNLMLGHPELIFVLLLFNYALGRWTGLRLMEYVRFREVMKHSEE